MNLAGTATRLEQLCGTGDEQMASQLENCELGWNGWQEVCACREDFCNTFAFLRGSIEQFQTAIAPRQRNSDHSAGAAGFPIVHTVLTVGW